MRLHLAALLPNAREGVSVRAVVGGWKSLVSAHHLIDEIGQDARAKAILGDRFDIRTALAGFLADAWGGDVSCGQGYRTACVAACWGRIRWMRLHLHKALSTDG